MEKAADIGDEGSRIKYMVEVYEVPLVAILQCRDLLPHVGRFFDQDAVRRIRKSERDGRKKEAVSDFLQCLSQSTEPGAYAAFRDALNEEECDHIADVLNGEPIGEDHYERCKLINEVFGGRIAEKIDPLLVMRHLKRFSLLSETDEQHIKHIHDSYSRMDANFIFLDCVFRKKRDWYDKLMIVLLDHYPHLVEDVDPDFKKKKEKQKEFETRHEDMEEDMGTMEEATLLVVGGPHKPHDNLAENPPLEKSHSVNKPQDEDSAKQTARKQLQFRGDASNEDDPDINTVVTTQGATQNNLSSLQPKLMSVHSISEIKEILKDDQTGNRNIPVAEGAASKTFTQSKSVLEDSSNQGEEEDDDNRPVQTLILRPYQEELARPALEGKNTIICAPTGSGKTYVATKIMQDHLTKPGVRKVVFFANQVALVHQQVKVIKDYMPREYRVRELSSETAEALKVPLSELLLRNDILVMTPQILVDALRRKEIQNLSEFTLLVFDECHHTNSKHPYNRIMFYYMDIKLNQDMDDSEIHLPQIVGLTASVGVGKARDISGAVDHICKLCSNLDAYYGVSTVTENEEDLAKHARTVGMDVKKTDRRKMDIFKNIVSDSLMKFIEKRMLDRVDLVQGRPQLVECLKAPVERGWDPYTQWVSKLRKEVAKIDDQKAHRFFFSCRRMLEIYNKSLAINEDCRTKDALNFLEKELENVYTADITRDETDDMLKQQFDSAKKRLREASQNPLCDNPKLTALCGMIRAAFEKEQESRCMVFVKTRDLAMGLKQWMVEDPILKYLKPGTFTGQNATADRGGMTRNQQLDAAELFRKGEHKVIIATSVAEEGMDFSQCNLVIRYEYVTNEIAMVQAKGRARAKDSQFVVVTGNHQGTAEKEELNLIRELMMNQAIMRLRGDISRNMSRFLADILQIQKKAKAERDSEAQTQKERVISDGEFELHCGKCSIIACFSTDIRRLKETNHVIIEPEFGTRIRVSPHPRPGSIGFELRKDSKIACKKCGFDWGIGVIYRNWKFAVIKIESFITVDSVGRRDSPKKWKFAPFIPLEISDDELASYRSLDISQ